MSRLRIGVDIDEVTLPLFPAWIARYNAANGTSWTEDDITQYQLEKDLGCSRNAIMKFLSPDIYDAIKPFDGVAEALSDIEALGHSVIFVTTCNGSENFNAKLDWLERHGFGGYDCYGTGKWNATYPTKNDVNVDWLIDDHIGNLEKFTRGYPVLVTRPHNRNLIWPGKRIKHLRDVIPLLKHSTPRDTGDGFAMVERNHPITGEPVVKLEASKTGYFPVEPQPAVRKFETGATRDTDTGKLDYEGFLSPVVLKRYAEYMHKHRFQSDGSLRDSANWQKGIPVDAYMKSLLRHVMDIWTAHRTGRPLPQEEACAVLFNTFGLLFEDLKTPTP